jgi:hypothetical protein
LGDVFDGVLDAFVVGVEGGEGLGVGADEDGADDCLWAGVAGFDASDGVVAIGLAIADGVVDHVEGDGHDDGDEADYEELEGHSHGGSPGGSRFEVLGSGVLISTYFAVQS